MLFKKVEDTDLIGKKVTNYMFGGRYIKHYLRMENVGQTKVNVHFETGYSTLGFNTREERDQFVKDFKKEYKEVNTIVHC